MTKFIRHGVWLLNRHSLDIHVITLTQSNQIKKSFNTQNEFLASILDSQIGWLKNNAVNDGARESLATCFPVNTP